MNIWVDADACPKVIKDIIYRAAQRLKIQVTLVSNQFHAIPESPYIRQQQVTVEPDEADKKILQHLSPGDLVITQDIPLASEVIERSGIALSFRGLLFTSENIKARLNMRDFMETMRASGMHSSGPASLNQQDRRLFANQLDKLLMSHQNNR